MVFWRASECQAGGPEWSAEESDGIGPFLEIHKHPAHVDQIGKSNPHFVSIYIVIVVSSKFARPSPFAYLIRGAAAGHLLTVLNPPSGSESRWNPLRGHQSRGKMAFSRTLQISLAVATFGILAFIFGVVAENKKPPMGTAIKGQGVAICKYPSDPTVALGILACLSLPVTAVLGLVAIFYPYNGKSVPSKALFRSTSLSVFYVIAVGVTILAQFMMMWATITEALHRAHNVHHNLSTDCPTAKTGLFGGAAFLALDAALFWLICQMLTINSRSDYLDYNDDPKGEYGQVVTTDFNGSAGAHNI